MLTSEYKEKQFGHLFRRTCNRFVTYSHGEHAWAVGEGAFVFEEVEVHLADVVLQVKGRGEVGLAVLPRANQHGLMGSVDPFVPPQRLRFLEHLLAHLARKRDCSRFQTHQ